MVTTSGKTEGLWGVIEESSYFFVVLKHSDWKFCFTCKDHFCWIVNVNGQIERAYENGGMAE